MSEYSGYDIVQLWGMVDAARQGLQPTQDQLMALHKAHQMLSSHADSLQTARIQVAANWPPETNTASAAYLVELDRLITAVRDTALSCAINVFHMNLVIDAIVQGHETLKPLYREYLHHEGALDEYNIKVATFADKAFSSSSGKAITQDAAKLFTSPAVADGRQDQLNRQAQAAMLRLSEAAHDSATYIKPPSLYEPPTVNSSYLNGSRTISDPGGWVISAAAAVPPKIAPLAYTRTPTKPSGPTGDGLQSSPSNEDSGPVLSGRLPSPTLPTSSAPLPTGPGVGGLGPTLTGQPIDRIPPNQRLDTSARGPSNRFSSVMLPQNSTIGPNSFVGLGTPQSGIIGGTSASTDASEPALPQRGRTPAGVIGQQPAPRGRSGAEVSPPSGRLTGLTPTGLISGQPGQGDRRSSSSYVKVWDPDNPWVVDVGTNPVIVPVILPEIDPGPGVIGLDR